MFIAVLLFLEVATGSISVVTSKMTFETIEQCQVLVDHDLPLIQATALEKFQDQIVVTGKCVPAAQKDDTV